MAVTCPFVETKEWLSGFILIETRDLNEALQVASKIPSARYGSIEVTVIHHHHWTHAKY